MLPHPPAVIVFPALSKKSDERTEKMGQMGMSMNTEIEILHP
jgi:hypothetical protein